jgi:hypothetical protein
LVGGLETNAVNVLGQSVRVVADLLNGVLAISLVIMSELRVIGAIAKLTSRSHIRFTRFAAAATSW